MVHARLRHVHHYTFDEANEAMTAYRDYIFESLRELRRVKTTADYIAERKAA